MTISCEENGIVDVVVVEMGKCSVLIRLISVPSIIIERNFISIGNRFVEARKDDLIRVSAAVASETPKATEVADCKNLRRVFTCDGSLPCTLT